MDYYRTGQEARNRFYVNPSLDISLGLSGISNAFDFMQNQQALEQKANKDKLTAEQKAIMTQEALDAYKSGDPDKIAEVALKYPEIAPTLDKLIKSQKSHNEEQYTQDLEKALTEIETKGNIPAITPVESIAIGEPELQGFNLTSALPKSVSKYDVIASMYKKNPEIGKKVIEFEFAKNNPQAYKNWKSIYRPEQEDKEKLSALGQKIKERQNLLDQGYKKDDPLIKAYDRAIWGEKKTGTEVTPSNLQKMMNERDALVDKLIKQGDPNPYENPDVKAFNRKILGEKAKEYAPTSIKKMAEEREARVKELEEQGMSPEDIKNDEIVAAYDMKLTGTDIRVEELTPEAVDFLGSIFLLTNKMPSVGRGKQATKVRIQILKAAAEEAKQQWGTDLEGKARDQYKVALQTIATSADTKELAKTISFLGQQYSSQQSFITNLNHQIDQIAELSKDLPLVDTRLLNVPIRLLAEKVAGHPELSKYEIYLSEIERELSKLASNATQSVAAPTDTEIKRWSEMIDPNLSIKDMLNVLDEVKRLAEIRVMSSASALKMARERARTREYPEGFKNSDVKYKTIDTQEEYDALPSGSYYIDKQTGATARKP